MNKRTLIHRFTKGLHLFCIATLLAGLALSVAPPQVAYAATIAVNSTADVIANDGQCTLREAITAANTDTASGAAAGECPAGSGTDTITLPAGTYTLTIAGTGENANATGDLDITGDLTITGAGTATTIIDGNANDRVFHIDPGGVGGLTVNISGLTIRNGNVIDGGGGIYNNGTLNIAGCTIFDNHAQAGDVEGGGLYNADGGDATLTNSTVSGNTAGVGVIFSDGGGILNRGTLTLTNCTVSGNKANGSGGGIYQQEGENAVCFTADTHVLLADGGYKRIADVQVGDATLGYDFVANRPVTNVVQQTFHFETDSYLQINGLEVTESHPFAVGPDQWVRAGQLQVGDGVVGDGFTEITHVARVYESINVYNLTVAGTHNFYVSDGSDLFLVHNRMVPVSESHTRLNNVTITNNTAGNNGGGIYNVWNGEVTLTNCTVSGNRANGGGGIYQQGGGCFTADTHVLLADGSYKPIADVQVGDATLGYDFVANGPVANVVQRTFQFETDSYLQINGLEVTESHPFAVGPDQWVTAGQLQVGDGVIGDGFTEITHVAWVYESIGVYNLTVAGTHNFYVSDGSDLFLVHNKMVPVSASGTRLNNVTITNNTAAADNYAKGGNGGVYSSSGSGGGIYSGGGAPTVDSRNTIIAGNDDPTSAPDCSGTLTSQDYNLVGDGTGCTFTAQTHDQVGTGGSPIDPKLDPLADNGGPTHTHALQPDSPALDAIPEEAGGDYNGAPGTDQRGVTRPQGDNCDIGAYEARPSTAGSSDPVGVGKDTYTTGETVYATGGGFPPNTNVDVYIVGDLAWTDGMDIPADVSSDGMNTVPTNLVGDLGPANVWSPPLTPGEYDMVFDANQNGTYDAATDVVDDPNHPGFVVQAPPRPIGGIIVPVNRLELVAPWMGLVTLAGLAALGVALVRRRRA